jgi:nicotinamidase-related amidase
MPTALLIIDAQNVFFDGPDGQPVHQAGAVLVNLTALVQRARAAGVPVIYIQHEDEDLMKPEPNWQLHPDLTPEPDEPVVEKTRPDAFFQTGLDALLKERGVDHLVIAGNQTDFCINATCRAAQALGYRVTLAADAHGTYDSAGQTAATIIARHNSDLGNGIAVVQPTDQIRFP